MRLTISLDQDLYDFTAAYAAGKGLSLSAAVGELIRRAERAPSTGAVSSRLTMNEYGYLEIAESGHVLTPEMVKELSEDPLA